MRANALTATLVLNLVAASGLVWLWHEPERSRWTEPAALPPSLEDVATTLAPEPAEVSRYRETLERPLFASTRRIAPRPPPGSEGQEAVDPLKDVRLLGTYGAGGRGGIVVVRAGKVERIAIGASLGDWKVAGEDGRGAALVRANGERRRLELALNTVAPTAPAAAAKTAEPVPGKGPPTEAPRAAEATPPSRAAEAAPAGASRAAAREATAPSEANDALAKSRAERLERLNARRAQRGLPPINPQN